MTPDLSEDETRALTDPLKHALNDDRCPLSPRIQMRRAILPKLDPVHHPAAEPPTPLPNTSHPHAPASPAGAAAPVSGTHTFSA
jgi:hypothetical protein